MPYLGGTLPRRIALASAWGAVAIHRLAQRYELLRDLARDPNRQILLVTATPHSGIEESFRSLLGLLDERFDRRRVACQWGLLES